MSMSDWGITGWKQGWGPNAIGWVYYVCQTVVGVGLHMSRSVDDPFQDHMATDVAPKYYYYGNTVTDKNDGFNGNVPQNIKDMLLNAWKDYYTVR